MRFDGRIERRVPTAVPVYVSSLNRPGDGERALTENVSPHGARLITKQPLRPNDNALITLRTGPLQLPARVVYCLPLPNARFCVGLEFQGDSVNWKDGASGSSA